MEGASPLLQEMKVSARRFALGWVVYVALTGVLYALLARPDLPITGGHLVTGTVFALGFVVFGRNICVGFGPPRFRVAASYLVSVSTIATLTWALWSWAAGS
ncbi:hypothetical protein GCM10027188_29660 [Lysobacter humi (ex Lee et al. 2017)]